MYDLKKAESSKLRVVHFDPKPLGYLATARGVEIVPIIAVWSSILRPCDRPIL